MFASVLVSASCIQPYIETHGEHTAFAFWQMALWRDYLTARKIAKRLGSKPRFLIWFEILSVTALALFIAGVVTALIGNVA